MTYYKYLGDKFTDKKLKNTCCCSVHRTDGKCIRGKNGNMLVEFNGIKTIIAGRLLRKISLNN